MKIYVHNVKAMEQSRPLINRMQVMLVGKVVECLWRTGNAKVLCQKNYQLQF